MSDNSARLVVCKVDRLLYRIGSVAQLYFVSLVDHLPQLRRLAIYKDHSLSYKLISATPGRMFLFSQIFIDPDRIFHWPSIACGRTSYLGIKIWYEVACPPGPAGGELF